MCDSSNLEALTRKELLHLCEKFNIPPSETAFQAESLIRVTLQAKIQKEEKQRQQNDKLKKDVSQQVFDYNDEEKYHSDFEQEAQATEVKEYRQKSCRNSPKLLTRHSSTDDNNLRQRHHKHSIDHNFEAEAKQPEDKQKRLSPNNGRHADAPKKKQDLRNEPMASMLDRKFDSKLAPFLMKDSLIFHLLSQTHLAKEHESIIRLQKGVWNQDFLDAEDRKLLLLPESKVENQLVSLYYAQEAFVRHLDEISISRDSYFRTFQTLHETILRKQEALKQFLTIAELKRREIWDSIMRLHEDSLLFQDAKDRLIADMKMNCMLGQHQLQQVPRKSGKL